MKTTVVKAEGDGMSPRVFDEDGLPSKGAGPVLGFVAVEWRDVEALATEWGVVERIDELNRLRYDEGQTMVEIRNRFRNRRR